MPNKDPLLNYEEFKKQRNSFHLHFAGEPGNSFGGDVYRQNPPFVKCLQKHPERLKKLMREIGPKATGIQQSTRAYEELLYKAYLLMYPYAESNQQLFD